MAFLMEDDIRDIKQAWGGARGWEDQITSSLITSGTMSCRAPMNRTIRRRVKKNTKTRRTVSRRITSRRRKSKSRRGR
jgi:hypothetical protein